MKEGSGNRVSFIFLCGTVEETSDHVLCECEALAHLGSFFLDLEDVMNLSMGAIWNYGKGTGLL
jgi:hypothetical protein